MGREGTTPISQTGSSHESWVWRMFSWIHDESLRNISSHVYVMGVTSWFHESWVLRRVLRKVCYSYVSAGALFNMQVFMHSF